MPNNRFMEAWFDFDIPLDKQVEMFERDGFWIKGNPEDTHKCINCGETKNQIYFYTHGTADVFNRKFLRSVCRVCSDESRIIVRKLTKENPRQTDNCDCCGKYSKSLECDHDHKTHKFRGWICKNCNSGIGKLGDDIKGLEQAKEYLRRTSE
jgi:hypothetical protein